MNQPESKISKATEVMMISVAVIIDIISCIPGINIAVAIVGQGLFFCWFTVSGVSYTKNTSIIRNTAIAFIVGLIPFISIAPEMALNVMLNIKTVRKQEQEEYQAQQVSGQKVSRIERVAQ